MGLVMVLAAVEGMNFHLPLRPRLQSRTKLSSAAGAADAHSAREEEEEEEVNTCFIQTSSSIRRVSFCG